MDPQRWSRQRSEKATIIWNSMGYQGPKRSRPHETLSPQEAVRSITLVSCKNMHIQSRQTPSVLRTPEPRRRQNLRITRLAHRRVACVKPALVADREHQSEQLCHAPNPFWDSGVLSRLRRILLFSRAPRHLIHQLEGMAKSLQGKGLA
jgi:hypothetical protein